MNETEQLRTLSFFKLSFNIMIVRYLRFLAQRLERVWQVKNNGQLLGQISIFGRNSKYQQHEKS